MFSLQVLIQYFLLELFSRYLLAELLDSYKNNEEKVAQNNTSTDQGGFIELTSHRITKENASRSGCC